ncbi:phosphonate ABC transporter, permease protein PhnE [Fructobacillus evanidus]|uniref:Permease component (PhnE) n=1 Tax=Fructobacillus evanidus TaxID=3064281 RepID=A0ABM9MSZ5_9LACO|nr:ABC-type phosphate/phosphonate transport system [Fructobacillus sp. LMG 32999]CAK1233658.1 ABC-type phosphate/phosphonate transport system [Fructobacillus sp. LMG 32999]CAK1236039.1 ABC-type phosphate/phosphonate transport system [Fructobacillus sp. LMG 32999]CAK1236775.1 ABC-type phosphate/phosphonate transport system [Fructobacillus sp. LMG 32999]CAK1237282.1 ABC-type phosphate/phosphonate transport system [Fructobacillus sp. LMG 32999]
MMENLPKRSFAQEWHLVGFGLFILFILLTLMSGMMTGAGQNFSWDQFFDLWVKMSNPDWSYLPAIMSPIAQTIQMALVGTLIGGVAAIPVSLLAAGNIVKNPYVRGLVRFLMNLTRSLPEMLLAALFVAVVGIGAFSGVCALAVFSFGMVFKLLYEAIETIDEGPLDAMKAAGANSIQIIVFAVFPQVFNQFLSFFLYTLEINVRASTVLGYLGAGGIGLYLNTTLEMFRYDRTAVVILSILVVVVIVDTISNQLREALA